MGKNFYTEKRKVQYGEDYRYKYSYKERLILKNFIFERKNVYRWNSPIGCFMYYPNSQKVQYKAEIFVVKNQWEFDRLYAVLAKYYEEITQTKESFKNYVEEQRKEYEKNKNGFVKTCLFLSIVLNIIFAGFLVGWNATINNLEEKLIKYEQKIVQTEIKLQPKIQ